MKSFYHRAIRYGMCIVIVVVGSVLFFGCGKSANDGGKISFPYPLELSADSSPTDVVKVFINALDNDDTKTLLGLVAVKAEREEIEKIYRKYGKKSNIKPEAVAALAVSGWKATYSFLQKNKTEVTQEDRQSNFAFVYARALGVNGQQRTLKFKLVREDGFWKALGGIETLPQ